MRILLISGSLRAGSTNSATLRTLQAIAPPEIETSLYDGMARLPHFTPDGDREGEPVDPEVARLRQSLWAADAVVICTPEYAGALPGALKNLLEWTVGDASTDGRPIAWINVSGPAAPTGGADAHASLRRVLGYVGAHVVESACLRMPLTRDSIGSDGELHRAGERAQLAAMLTALARDAHPPTSRRYPASMILDAADPIAERLGAAIRGGDLAALAQVLVDGPGLARARVRDRRGSARTPLHLATDFPGHFPNGPAIVQALIDAGADPNARLDPDTPSETPLHWAASSDDLEVAEVLLDAGADIDARGAMIAGGTPLDDACAFGCWNVAHLLVRRGARIDDLWKAAALGLQARVDELIAVSPPDQEALDHALWQACHGGQPRTAAALIALGGNPDWHPGHNDATAWQIAASPGQRRETLIARLARR